MEIQLYYRLSAGERALVTTRKHPRLVDMVNQVKEEYAGAPGGAFYINEYRFVLVPATGDCFYAGQYDEILEFEFEGLVISPKAPQGLGPGDSWPGPRVGTAYTLTADGRDVRYTAEPRPNVEIQRRLSAEVGATSARRLAQRLSRYKRGGGRIYINEAREFFAPAQADNAWTCIYLGNLEDDDWFPSPKITGG